MMALGNMDSIARLVARELRSRDKITCPRCKAWVFGDGEPELTKALNCKRCDGKGWI